MRGGGPEGERDRETPILTLAVLCFRMTGYRFLKAQFYKVLGCVSWDLRFPRSRVIILLSTNVLFSKRVSQRSDCEQRTSRAGSSRAVRPYRRRDTAMAPPKCAARVAPRTVRTTPHALLRVCPPQHATHARERSPLVVTVRKLATLSARVSAPTVNTAKRGHLLRTRTVITAKRGRQY